MTPPFGSVKVVGDGSPRARVRGHPPVLRVDLENVQKPHLWCLEHPAEADRVVSRGLVAYLATPEADGIAVEDGEVRRAIQACAGGETRRIEVRAVQEREHPKPAAPAKEA